MHCSLGLDTRHLQDVTESLMAIGTQVALGGTGQPMCGLVGDEATNRFAASFGLRGERYGLKIAYDAEPVDPTDPQNHDPRHELEAAAEQAGALTRIGWTRKPDWGLDLGNGGGEAHHPFDVGVVE